MPWSSDEFEVLITFLSPANTTLLQHVALIEQGLTSPPTQYRLSGRRFYRS